MRCPRCGKGKLFNGYLTVVRQCSACALPLADLDSGDGAAVIVIFIVGGVVGGLALWTETHYAPPVWVHMMLWLPLLTILSVGLLRPIKGAFLAMAYQHNAGEGQLDE